ncbi:MAG: glycoside hydrolase family 3 protein [Anaerolineae bacterium]|nr:glycoside hydrolase family 3 protein [Anaerolineae bacterium]
MVQSTSLATHFNREHDIDGLLAQMTLAEKIGQMTQIEKNSITPAEAAEYFIGSILSGGGGNPDPNSAATWRHMVHGYLEAALTTRLRIPLIYGVDAVHGHSNAYGATIFPHNVGLGATRDPDIIRQIGQATARELLAVGVHWNFAPAVSVPQDYRWGRAYEGYSEDTGVVSELAVAYLQGLQDPAARVMASVKHYIGDGGTTWGTSIKPDWVANDWQAPKDTYSIDQGDARDDEATFRAIHLAPYIKAIAAGAVNIMVSFNSYHGLKMHAHHYWLTDVLKGELGFGGFLISDWAAIYQISEDFYTCVVESVNAGVDMIMVPYDFRNFIAALTKAVEVGDVSMERIDDAVRRILRAKYWLGIFEHPLGRPELMETFGSAAHRAIARTAAQKSMVLLKNDGVLPISKGAHVAVAGRGADNIGLQCGGWTIEWQGKLGKSTIGTSILEGVQAAVDGSVQFSDTGEFARRAQVGLVVIGETPYAEGWGDNGELTLDPADVAVVQRVRSEVDQLVVVLLSGRPLIISAILDTADAVVAAWLPGSEAHGVVDALFGDAPITGKLGYTWLRSADQLPRRTLLSHPDGPLFPFGYGLTTASG